MNALYYNIKDFSIVDYTGGLADLKLKRLRVIGNPSLRYQEDPIRMVRALRFAARLEFDLDEQAAAPMTALAELLLDVPPMRLYEELIKCFLCGCALRIFSLLQQYTFFALLFPVVEKSMVHNELCTALIKKNLENTDERLREGKTVNPAFMIAALLWYPMNALVEQYKKEGLTLHAAHHQAFSEVFRIQNKTMLIPRRISYMVCDIWILQLRLERRTPKRVARLLQHTRFRAAYDFLLLRANVGEADTVLAAWWTDLQHVNPKERADMIAKVQSERQHQQRKTKSNKKK